MSSYATIADLTRLGVSANALSGVDTLEQEGAIASASNLADGYLATRFTLPIVTPSADLVEAVCKIAAYNILAIRGYNPELGADEVLRARHKDAIAWMEGVAAGRITPPLVDSTPGGVAALGGPFVTAAGPQREW